MHIIMISRARIKRVLAFIGIILLLLLALLWPGHLIDAVLAGERLLPVYEVATDQQAVSISFDASWGAERTLAILDTLDEYGVKCTFFLVNIWLEDYPEMAREIAMRGHEIGLHSVSHPRFSLLSEDQIKKELADNFALVQELTGYSPSLFRPPFGDYNNRVIRVTREAGYTPIQWSIDSLDWQDLSADEICERVVRDIHAGDIVLFHNNGLHTAEALPAILGELQARDLAVVPISQLLLTGDCYIDVNGIQRRQ